MKGRTRFFGPVDVVVDPVRAPMKPPTASPSSSSASSASSASSTDPNAANSNPNPNSNPNSNSNPGSSSNAMPSWWESISKARSRINALAALLSLPHLASLADSDRPARSLLESPDAYAAVSAALSRPSSGSGDDSLCQWLYDTFLSADPDLRLVVLSFLPLLAGLYLHRVVSPDPQSLAGFEAVLLAVYGTEAHARAGKPLLVSVPDLSQPSLYHTPRPQPRGQPSHHQPQPQPQPSIGVLSPPLEPHRVVKSTKRACIVAVALDCYYSKISLMPSRSKVELCNFVASWAGQDCPCCFELDDERSPFSPTSAFSPEIRSFSDGGETGNLSDEMGRLAIRDRQNGHCNGDEGGSRASRGSRVPLPWELLQPVLRIVGHCLMAPLNPQEVRDAASVAARCVYARASHDLLPPAILAARSLIQLDKGARKAVRDTKMAAAAASSASNPNTPSKPKKPEVFLVSK